MRIDTSISCVDIDYTKRPHADVTENSKGIPSDSEVNLAVNEFKKALGKEDFERIIESLKDMPTELTLTRLEFKIHDDTKRIIVKIFDKSSDKLISEIPPEKFLDLVAGLWKQAGLILDEKA